MPRSTPKSKLEAAQDKIKEAAKEAAPFRPLENYPEAAKPQNQSGKINQNTTTFNPADYIASDLFSDSSSLPRTNKVDADKAIQSISEKKETLRLIGANITLNTEAFKVGSLAEKMNQANIVYQTDGVNTQTKIVDFEKAGINLQISQSKLYQTQEKLEHQNIELAGLKAETPLRQQYWTAKLSLIESRIAQVELAKFQLDAKIGAIESEAEVIE